MAGTPDYRQRLIILAAKAPISSAKCHTTLPIASGLSGEIIGQMSATLGPPQPSSPQCCADIDSAASPMTRATAASLPRSVLTLSKMVESTRLQRARGRAGPRERSHPSCPAKKPAAHRPGANGCAH